MDLQQVFHKKIGAEIEECEKHGHDAFVSYSSTGRPMSEEKIAAALGDFEIPSILLDNYRLQDHFHQNWEIQESTADRIKNDEWFKLEYSDYSWSIIGETYIGGGIWLPGLLELLGKTGEEAGFQLVGKHIGYDVSTWHPIDYQTRYTAFLKSEYEEVVDNVWLMDVDGREVFDMEVSVEKYFDLCSKVKAFHGWQPAYVLREKSEHYEMIKRFLPQIFPHVELDLTEFGIEV